MNNPKTLVGVVCGGVIGIAIGLAGKALIIDPHLASERTTSAAEHKVQVDAELRTRDELTAAELHELDPRLKKAACEGYIGGLREQNLPISTLISTACSGS